MQLTRRPKRRPRIIPCCCRHAKCNWRIGRKNQSGSCKTDRRIQRRLAPARHHKMRHMPSRPAYWAQWKTNALNPFCKAASETPTDVLDSLRSIEHALPLSSTYCQNNLFASPQAMFEVKKMANQKGRNPKRKNAPINPPSRRRNKYGELKPEFKK